MDSYGSLLQRDEWKAKRLEILRRDGFSCACCKRKALEEITDSNIASPVYVGLINGFIKKNDIKSIRILSKEQLMDIHGYTALHVHTLRYSSSRFLLPDNSEDIILSAIPKGFSIMDSSIEFADVVLKDGRAFSIEKSRNLSLRNLKNPIQILERSTEPKYLNVHHKLYRQDRNPWDYDNGELITLCEECHERLHRSGEIVKWIKLTPCYRCGGKGYLPQYKHVEDGICFRCRGEKYEEYIDHETEYGKLEETRKDE